jgi:hypothetical protein
MIGRMTMTARSGKAPSGKVRWGVLSTANIGVNKVIPGMQ